MRLPLRLLLIAGLAMGFIVPAHAQVSQDEPARTSPAEGRPPARNDIVVNGQRNGEPLRNAMTGESASTSRSVSTDSHHFARCLKGVALTLQRKVVEGHPRDRATQKALDRLIRSHAGCYPRFRAQVAIQSDYFGKCNPVLAGSKDAWRNPEVHPSGKVARNSMANLQTENEICRAPYDRGAIVQEAFLSYAPHFMLTRYDTLNKEAIARFRAREALRGKHRGPMDRRYYDTVACMVQLDPEDSVRLLRAAPDENAEEQLRMRILAKTSYCTGNAKTVSVDPPQFRGYLADAVYHWTIAAKNIETLIPAN